MLIDKEREFNIAILIDKEWELNIAMLIDKVFMIKKLSL